MANYSSNVSFSGLGTITIGAPNTGTYALNGTLTLPSIAQGSIASSQVVVTININGGGTLYTGLAGAESFSIIPLVVSSANSTINVILSSSAPVDQQLQAIKTSATLSELT